MKFYFVRHGESEANVLGIISNRGLSYGLTELGRQQAQALAKSLTEAGVTRIYATPLLRAKETAAILSESLGVTYHVTEALREIDCGILEGKSDAASWQMIQTTYETWLSGDVWAEGIEGGDTLEDIILRFTPFVFRLESDLPPQSVVVFVGHGGLFRCALPFVFHNLEPTFTATHGLDNAAVVIGENSGTGFRCLSWGDTVFPSDD